MVDENPYAPPDAEVDVAETGELAGRGARLGGVIIDQIIIVVLVVPLTFVMGYWDRAAAGVDTFTDTLWIGLMSIVAFLLVHGYPLATRGQSVGKILVQTRIVSVEDGKILPFSKLIALRYLPLWVAAQIPVVAQIFGLADALFVFRDDRRCIHDLIAGTRVIKA